jgi:uncharacterized coiled-coil DUF342 family protein
VSKDQREKEIEQLSKRLSELNVQRKEATDQMITLADQRDDINEKVRTLRAEILEKRGKRDRLNEQVQDYKLQRAALREKIYDKIDEIQTMRQKKEVIAKKKPQRSHRSLQEEVDDLDWEIQTTLLTPQEEKELVEQVRQLEIELSAHKKHERLLQRIHELQAEIKATDAQGRAVNETLKAAAQRSQEFHKEMIIKIEDSKKLKAEADKLHQLFAKAKEKAAPIKAEIIQVSNDLRRIKGEIREEEDQKRRQSEESLREKLQAMAKEKLKRGEKLTWDEFKLLNEGQNEESED